jgi:DNA-binding transcriptional ArsR family regulator
MQEIKDEENNSHKVLVLPLNEDSKKVTQALSNDKALKMLEILADKPMSATSLSEKMGLPLTTIKYNLDSLIEADLIKVKETKWSQKGREVKIYEPVQKLIVVVPGTKNVDRTSIMGILKKYMALFIAAIFAASGIEYLTRKMGLSPSPEYYPLPLEEASRKYMEYNGFVNENIDSNLIVADEVTLVEEGSPIMSTMISNASTEVAEETSLSSYQVLSNTTIIPSENLTTSLNNTIGVNATAFNTTDLNSTLVPGQYPHVNDPIIFTVTDPGLIPPDILAHVSVWFFFGCLFVIIFMLMREIYYRKKTL